MASYYRMAAFSLIMFAICIIYSEKLLSVGTANAKNDGNILAAKEFQLVDDNGTIRAGMKYDIKGNPVLYFTDDKGRLKSYLCVSGNRPLLVFKDDNNINKMMLFMNKKGQPGLLLRNDKDKISMALGNANDENCIASFFDSKGQPRMILGLSDNQPRIGMFDKEDRLRVMFGMNPNNSSILAFLDEKAYPGLGMGHMMGTPLFMLQRPGRTGIFASYAPENNVILSMQKKGEFAWSVPEIPRGGSAMDDPLRGIDWGEMIKGWSK